MAKQIKQIKSFRKGQKVFVKGLRKPGTVDRVYAKDEVLEISFGPTRADPGGWVSVFAFDEIKGYRNPFVFKDVKIGHNFRFRFGGRGERGPCRKVGKRSYVLVGNEKRFTVGSIYVEVAQGWQA